MNRGAVYIGSQSERAPENSVWGHVESLAADCDRIFVDGAEERDWDSISRFGRETRRVLVLVPDSRCLLRLRHLEETCFQSGSGFSLPPYLLLNQFDAENQLHLQIRERLQLQMKGRLIPVSIRRDPTFQDALPTGEYFLALSDIGSLLAAKPHAVARRTLRPL